MRILALDLATSTGWATSTPELGVESGTQRFDVKRGESPGMRFLRFRRWLADMLDTVHPEVVVYELPHHRGGYATQVLVGLSTRVEELCAERDIEHESVRTSPLKKHITGAGRASKEDMMAAAKRLFPKQSVDTDDQADALCVLKWAEDTLQVD